MEEDIKELNRLRELKAIARDEYAELSIKDQKSKRGKLIMKDIWSLTDKIECLQVLIRKK